MRQFPRRLAALIVAPLLVLTACGDDDSSSSSEITVSGEFGEAPKVEIPDDYSVDESTTEVVVEGDGEEIAKGDKVLVHIAAYNGRDGKEFLNSYSGEGAQPTELEVTPDAAGLPGIADGMEGQTVGSRLAISLAPEDAFGETGNPQSGIEADDTVVVVLDLLPKEDVPEATGSIDDIEVSGKIGSKPSVEFDQPLYVDDTESKVVTEGDGATVKADDTVKVDYLGINGRDGKEFDSSFKKGGAPADFPLTEGQLIPGFIEGLVGQKLGSRVVIAMPRDDGYGAAGNAQAGIEGTDTLVFVVDLIEPEPQPKATGSVDDIKVTGAAGKSPKVTFDKPFYVTKTATQVIEEGDGATLKEGDSATVNYVGINGRDGKEFDSSYKTGEPVEFQLAEGQLIPGFIEGLVGQKVGSQVAIAIPRDDGYGDTGNEQAGIKGTDTLVFVIEIVEPAKGDESGESEEQ